MSTPEMRATCSSFSRTPDPLPSTLALLVARVLADDDDLPVPADHFALFTHRLDARSNLHVLVLVSYCSLDTAPAPAVRCRLRCPGLLVAVGDPPPSQVVGGDLHLHLVPGEDADAVHPHLSGAVGQHFVAILELHPEHGVGQRLNDHSLEHDGIFLRLGQVNLLDILLISYHVGPVVDVVRDQQNICLLYTSPSPRDRTRS